MKEVYLQEILVDNYRNFQKFSADFSKNTNIFIGQNGSGKTNILEAISFLSPGKGLKSAKFDEVVRYDKQKWVTNFKLKSKLGSAEIFSSYDRSERCRKIFYNGTKISSGELSNLINVIWLTPQMEGLFLGSSSARRKFIDRIVFSFNIHHAKHIMQYEYYMRERAKFLTNKNVNLQDQWFNILEKKMAELALEIITAREQVIELMQESINRLETDFPKFILSITPLFESEEQWESFELSYIQILQANRQKDLFSGRTNFGIHKSDFEVLHKGKNQPARQCSTGEQKALLISIIIASIESILQNTQESLILLLDELFTHLDDIRKKALSLYINQRKVQTFITATDINGIENLASNAHIIEL